MYFTGLHLNYKQEPVPDNIKTLAEYKKAKAEPKYTAIVLLSRILPNEIIKSIIQMTKREKKREQEQMSYFVIDHLYKAIEEGNLNEFKRIYDDEYINNEDIINTFNYPEYGCGRIWTDYEYCTCDYSDIEQVYKYTYSKECTCSGGKRYLVFIELYLHAHVFIHLDTESNQTKKKKKNKEKNVYQEMMEHIVGSGLIDMSFTGLAH